MQYLPYPIRLLRGAVFAAMAIAGATGCFTVGPDYVAPVDTAPAAWQARLPDGLTSGTADAESLAAWWAAFDDPVLTDLIQQSIAKNLDLKSAESRVREARARRAIAGAGSYPTLAASASATHTNTWARAEGLGSSSTESNLYRGGFDASWEIDVFGGQRRSVEASEYDMQATEAALYDTLVSLTAEVALNYSDLRADQTRLALAAENLRLQKETLDLVEMRYRAEDIDELPVQQARAAYESTAAQIPSLQTSLNESMNRLAVLLGEQPGALREQLSVPGSILSLPSSVSVGAPSEMLRRRPDIRQAERQLAAQTARIGVAVADLYPKFYLNGSASRQGEESGIIEYPTHQVSIGPNVSWNLFKAGALRQNVKVQTEVKEQDWLAYESAVLGALEEAENRIFSLGQERTREEKLAAAVAATQNAARMSRDQYDAGLVDFSEVLGAQQSLVSLQDQLAQSRATMATDLISLFKALGGGWAPMDEPESPLAQAPERKNSDEQ